MIGYTGPNVKNGRPVENALFAREGPDTVRERLLDPARYLSTQLLEIEGLLERRGDYVPSLCPMLGVIGIPSAFGCEVIWWEDDLPAVRPLAGDDPNRVFDLPQPSVTDGELGRILEFTRYFLEHTGARIPIRITDVQGPLDSAALILGHNNFLMAMVTHPQAVHHLLHRVTDLTIEVVQAYRSLIQAYGGEFVPTINYPWMPDGMGVQVAHDECVMISSAMHDEFAVPYLNQISDAFGGVFIHSCGKWAHQIESLRKVHHLRGLEFGASEAPYGPMLDAFGGEIALVTRVGLNRDVRFDGMVDFVKRILARRKTNRGLFVNVDVTNGLIDVNWPATDLEEIYHLIDTL
ncbi:MAG: uroporphyrinogen decarboxylase family protein [Chloroflexota bacterium]